MATSSSDSCGASLTIGGVKHKCQHPKHKGTRMHSYQSVPHGYVVTWHDTPQDPDPDHDGDRDVVGQPDTDSGPTAG